MAGGEKKRACYTQPSSTTTAIEHARKIYLDSSAWFSNTMVYAFKRPHSPLICFIQAPLVDAIAIRFLDGRFVIRNIWTDTIVKALR